MNIAPPSRGQACGGTMAMPRPSQQGREENIMKTIILEIDESQKAHLFKPDNMKPMEAINLLIAARLGITKSTTAKAQLTGQLR